MSARWTGTLMRRFAQRPDGGATAQAAGMPGQLELAAATDDEAGCERLSGPAAGRRRSATGAMKILFCNYEYPPLGGGGGVINALLAEELAKRHDVSVLTSCAMNLDPMETRRGVRIVRVPVPFRRHMAAANIPSLMGFVVQGILRGRELVRRERPDVINTHFALPSGPVGDRLAREIGCPNILSVHGGDLYDPSKWTSPHRHYLLRHWIARLMHRADCVVGQSADTIENTHRFYAPDLEVHQIPLGISRPPAVEGRRADWGLAEDDVVLATVGRLVGRKAIDQLIEMMRELPERARLVIIGDGPIKPELEALSQRLDLGARVRFTGAIDEDDKFRLLRMADLFVSTSKHEGFGLVFLEAMAAGLPVICYDKGGQTDFLEDHVTGRLIPAGERAAFVEALKSSVENRHAHEVIKRHNLEAVEAFFIEHCARRYEALFEATLAARA